MVNKIGKFGYMLRLILGGLAFDDIVGRFCNCISIACLAKIDVKMCDTALDDRVDTPGRHPEAYLIV